MPIKTNHADLLNALSDMKKSILYACRKATLAEAETLIVSQESRIADLERQLAESHAREAKDYTELLDEFNAVKAQNVRMVAQLAERQPTAQQVEDATRLNAIAENYWKVDPFSMPTPGGDDADVGWRVVQYHMGQPAERVVAEVYKDDLRASIDAALQAGKEKEHGET